jgi:L-amino acid N-acyltransferase YncA
MIRRVKQSDAQQICNIYNYYVANTIITFEEVPVTEQEMKKRIAEISTEFPWLVFEAETGIAGFAYASRWKSRSAYRYSVESTVYVAQDKLRKKIGQQLLSELIVKLKTSGIHSIIAGIALPNLGSVGLHEKFGFKKIGEFAEVGWKFNQWINVGYWELLLD